MSCPSFVTAESQYKKHKELKKEDVNLLQEWAEKQPHFPQLTELQIIIFLHCCYFSNERAKICMEKFFTIRALSPEFASNRNPLTNTPDLLDVFLFAPLPKLTPDGYKIIFIKLMDCDPDRFHLATQMKALDMTTMLTLQQEGPSEGQFLLVDFEGITFGHVGKFGLVVLHKFFIYLQEAMPVRLVGLHFIHIPSFMDKIMALIKPFMKKELLSVLELHTDNLENLYKSVPQECLPRDYGGTADSVMELLEKRKKNITDHAAYFVEEEKMVADESKRVGKPKNASDVFGVEGTFKKLDID